MVSLLTDFNCCRFGIVQSAPADEEVKKKARLARFGSSSLTDSAEEDKKKARALRLMAFHLSTPCIEI